MFWGYIKKSIPLRVEIRDERIIILANYRLIIVIPLFPVAQVHTTTVPNHDLEAEEWRTWLNIIPTTNISNIRAKKRIAE